MHTDQIAPEGIPPPSMEMSE